MQRVKLTKREPFPWFRFYIRDWMESEARLEMTLEQQALYLNLCIAHYRDGSIPNDPAKRARLVSIPLRTERRLWPAIAHKFEPDPSDPTRLVNGKCLSELGRIDEFRERQSHNRTCGKTVDENTANGTKPGLNRNSVVTQFPKTSVNGVVSPTASTNQCDHGSTYQSQRQSKREEEDSSDFGKRSLAALGVATNGVKIPVRREASDCPCGFHGRGCWADADGRVLAIESCPQCHRKVRVM